MYHTIFILFQFLRSVAEVEFQEHCATLFRKFRVILNLRGNYFSSKFSSLGTLPQGFCGGGGCTGKFGATSGCVGVATWGKCVGKIISWNGCGSDGDGENNSSGNTGVGNMFLAVIREVETVSLMALKETEKLSLFWMIHIHLTSVFWILSER